MSLCDCRGRFANGKEMVRRRSVSREPQACLRANRLYRGVLRQEALTQPFTKRTDKRADELISDSLRKC